MFHVLSARLVPIFVVITGVLLVWAVAVTPILGRALAVLVMATVAFAAFSGFRHDRMIGAEIVSDVVILVISTLGWVALVTITLR